MAGGLLISARLTAESVYKTFLRECPKLGSVDQKNWDTIFTIGSLYSAMCRLVTEGIDEKEITRILDETSAEASRVFPGFALILEECNEFVDGLAKQLYADKKYDKDFAFSDALGTWLFTSLLKYPPHSDDDIKLVRQVGLHMRIPFALTWEKK